MSSDDVQKEFRNQRGDPVLARWTDSGRVVLTIRPAGPDIGTLIVSEEEAEAMFDRGELLAVEACTLGPELAPRCEGCEGTWQKPNEVRKFVPSVGKWLCFMCRAELGQ